MPQEIKQVLYSSQEFPLLLNEIPNPPDKLFICGELPFDNSIKIAIVGTRKATDFGKKMARSLAKNLGELGIIIVSGLAMGIDTAAHQGALDASAKTIAVLANGLNKIYPAQNENLAKEIITRGGALISEYPVGTPSFPSQFLERNRIISGLCAATIIIEAPNRSGSLATARFAIEQGREVFVIPGPAGHANYTGSHKLIRDGARLITSIEDLLEDLGFDSAKLLPDPDKESISFFENSTAEEKLILTALKNSAEPIGVDKISEATKLTPQIINQILAVLVINGIAKETEHGYGI